MKFCPNALTGLKVCRNALDKQDLQLSDHGTLIKLNRLSHLGGRTQNALLFSLSLSDLVKKKLGSTSKVDLYSIWLKKIIVTGVIETGMMEQMSYAAKTELGPEGQYGKK